MSSANGGGIKDLQMTSEQYIEAVLKTASGDQEAIAKRLSDPTTINLLHAVMGMSTEAGELLDMLKRHIFYGKDLDLVNIEEELGDSDWYESLGIHALRMKQYFTSWEQIWRKNVAKLQKRYSKGTFTEEDAKNRDLAAERKVLEEDPLVKQLVLERIIYLRSWTIQGIANSIWVDCQRHKQEMIALEVRPGEFVCQACWKEFPRCIRCLSLLDIQGVCPVCYKEGAE